MKILFRADSSSTIGVGHIMRDLVLAKQLEDTEDGDISFACQALEGSILATIPYTITILRTNESTELIALIKSLHVELLVIDHYSIDASFEQKVKEATGVKILSFDDTYVPHHCDILLNHNLYADTSRYKDLVPSYCELRCGTPLIRDEFKEEKSVQREKIYDVFVAMGGADITNITLPILKTLPKYLHVSVVTTSANAHLAELETYAKENANISLHVNTKEVAKLLHQSKLAIVTPSVMVHEVLFMEVPFIAIKTAPNQDNMCYYLKNNGYPALEAFNEHQLRQLYNA